MHLKLGNFETCTIGLVACYDASILPIARSSQERRILHTEQNLMQHAASAGQSSTHVLDDVQ